MNNRKVEGEEIVITPAVVDAEPKRYSLDFAQWQLDNINREIQEYEDRVIDAKARRKYWLDIVEFVTPIIEAKKEEERLTEEE